MIGYHNVNSLRNKIEAYIVGICKNLEIDIICTDETKFGCSLLNSVYLKLMNINIHLLKDRSSHQRCSIQKGALRNFTKFTGKHLCQSLFFNKVAGLLEQWFIIFACRPPKFLKSDSHLLKRVGFISFKRRILKMMKNAFYFMLKAHFVLKIFNFLPDSWVM